MIFDWCCFEDSIFCSGSLGRRCERGGRGGKPYSGTRRALQRFVSVSPTEESVELEESLSGACEAGKVREEKEWWGMGGGGGDWRLGL